MKKPFLLFSVLAYSLLSHAQVFPSLKPAHKKQLLASGIKIPLPTWLPDGFSVDTFEIKTGKSIPAEEKILSVMYTKKINDSTWQSIMVEADFQNDLEAVWHDPEKAASPVGEIKFYYQPDGDVIGGKKTKKDDFITTDWIYINKIAFTLFSIVSSGREFNVMGDQDESESKYKYIPVSKDDFKKILQSLEILK